MQTKYSGYMGKVMMVDLSMEAISASGQCIFSSYAFFPKVILKNPNGLLARAVNAMLPHIGWAMRIINRFPRLAAVHLPMIHQTGIFSCAIGMKMDLGRYLEIGERGYTMERLINTRFGVSADNDRLPKRLTDVPQDPSQPNTRVPLEVMKKSYYKARGWDERGIPTEKTLRRLKIK